MAEVPIEDVGEWSRKPGHLVWVGLHEPGLDLLRRLQRECNLHKLAIEDALKAHQRPKLEQYGEALFMVARTAQMLEGRIAFGETRNAAIPLVEVCRRLGQPGLRRASMPHCTHSSATSPTTSGECRRRSSPCVRCWPSPSRPA